MYNIIVDMRQQRKGAQNGRASNRQKLTTW